LDQKVVTLKDISEHLGVSVTTVYKALNHKPKVGDELREKILDTAAKMGYIPNRMAQALARKPLTIAAVVPKYPEEFMIYIEQGVRSAFEELKSFNVTGILEVVKDKQEVESAWKSLYQYGVSGIVSCFNQYNKGISSFLDEMPHFDIPIIAITTIPRDNTPCIGKFLASGKALGRMAGQLLGMFCAPRAPVACLIPDLIVDIHVNTVQAFSKECVVWNLDYRGTFFSTHNNDETYDVTEKLLAEQPDLQGLYVGSSNSYPVCKCVEDKGLEKQIRIIGHDLYPNLADCLRKGTLTASLFQNQNDNAHKSVIGLFNYLWKAQTAFQSQYYRPEVVMKANLDLYQDMY